MSAPAAAPGALHYVASSGCSSCPYRSAPCHEARQRVQDPRFSVGRHYECEFYRAIDAAQPKVSLPRPVWREFFGSGG